MSATPESPEPTHSPRPSRSWSRRQWIWLSALSLVAVAAFNWPLLSISVWFDEGFTDTLIGFSFADIWRYTAADVHPPLYYWTLKAWSLMFGDSVVALRMLSVTFAAAAIVLATRLASLLFSKRAATATAIALFISPVTLRYAHEMRMYAMVAMLAFAATLMLLRASASGRRRDWTIYGLLIAAGMWTHYFMVLVWLSHWAWRAVAVHRTAPGWQAWMRAFFSRSWLATHMLGIALFLPWVPAVVTQMKTVRKGGFWIPEVSWSTLPGFVSDTLAFREFGELSVPEGICIFAIAAACVVLGVRAWRRSAGRARRGWLLLFCLAGVPPVLLLLFSLPPLTSSFISRYLVPSSLALTMIAAIAVTWPDHGRVWRFVRGATGIALVATLCFGMAAEYRLGDFNKVEQASSESQSLIAQIRERSGDNAVIVADTPIFYYEASTYETDASPVLYIPPLTYEWGSLAMLKDTDIGRADDLPRLAADNGSIWVISQVQQSSFGEGYDGLAELSRFTMTDPITGRDLYLAVQYGATS